MGQQQLLLVILVTILVGIATVVGINVFGTSAENANRDAVRNDIAQIASSAQGYYIKPTTMEGGGNSFSNLDFQKITFPGVVADDATTEASNANGTYTIEVIESGAAFTIVANPGSSDEDISARVERNGLSVVNGSTPPTDLDGSLPDPDPAP